MSGPFGSSHWVYNPSSGFYGHELDQSVRLNNDDGAYLTRTPTSAGNRKTWTWSAWVKRSSLSANQYLFQARIDDSTAEGNKVTFYFMSSDKIRVLNQTTVWKETSAVFRDTSAWYHIVLTVDTTDSTATDRIKLYINGELALYSTSAGPSLNADLAVNSTSATHHIGQEHGGYSYFDGYMSEINFIDGTALTPASFGETKDGIWIPKDTSGLTFGTNGFRLTFKDDVVSEGFNSVTWRGTGATNSISGLGFTPALVWIKDRTDATVNYLTDVVRGVDKELYSDGGTDGNSDTALGEYTDTNTLTTLDADGFTVGSSTGTNGAADDMVAWCWEADTSFSNDASATSIGNVDSTGRTNTAKGFSIITWTFTNSVDNLVAHGLGAVPKFIIVKSRTTAYNWDVYHVGLSSPTKRLMLNQNGTEIAGFFDTTPTSTVFEYNTSALSNNDVAIAYCWTDIAGYSKFGSFTGNGGSQEITVGFKPALVVIKRALGASSNWHVFDNTRNPSNNRSNVLNWDRTAPEATNGTMTFSDTGFNDNGWISDAGHTIIYMAWADTREAAFFKDVSGQGNHFTPVNLDYRDSVPDVPTNNFATANSQHKRLDGTVAISEGNLKISAGASYGGDNRFAGTTAVSSGKWYFEMLRTDATGLGNQTATGVFDADTDLSSGNYSGNPTSSGAATNEWALTDRGVAVNGSTYTNLSGTVGTVTQNKVVQVAVDMDNKKIWFGIDNTFSGNPAAGSGEAFSNLPNTILPMLYTAESTQVFNFGQDSSFAGNKSTANSNADGNGHGSFAYAPPTGFLALCSRNLPEPAIVDGSENFNTVLWTGNNSAPRSITGVGFSPDWIWVKDRVAANNHVLVDTVRGISELLYSNSNIAAVTGASQISAVGTDGFTIGANTYMNENGSSNTYVGWNWLAATAFSNDASATSVGTIDCTGRVNTKAGLSIISYTGNGATGATVAHGLSSALEFYIIKNRDAGFSWTSYHAGKGAAHYIQLDSSGAATSTNDWNGTAPTSSVFTVSGDEGRINKNGTAYIAYCFHSVEGYSKVGSYVGNGNADGPFIHTGFRPAWILIKNITDANEEWEMWDNTRDPHNVVTQRLRASTNGADVSSTFMDFVSNGVKQRNYSGGYNASNKTYIYLAFADQPFKYSNAR